MEVGIPRLMNRGSISINQWAISLPYIFRSLFKREIGLKFWGDAGSFPGLGRVKIKALIILGRKGEEAVAAL